MSTEDDTLGKIDPVDEYAGPVSVAEATEDEPDEVMVRLDANEESMELVVVDPPIGFKPIMPSGRTEEDEDVDTAVEERVVLGSVEASVVAAAVLDD
ncbi:hypothetical protein H2203_002137 [Taxawa tesnikishii (nom. ined.)]|nr:hypothetical protein H2203_002137 [Dothideales sp. JES 119]